MYRKNNDQDLEVILTDTQKQTNDLDCGVVAIAHLTEFCIKGVFNPYVGFDSKKMRTHLQSCLESGNLLCFPTVSKRPNIRNRNRTKCKSVPSFFRLPDCVRGLMS